MHRAFNFWTGRCGVLALGLLALAVYVGAYFGTVKLGFPLPPPVSSLASLIRDGDRVRHDEWYPWYTESKPLNDSLTRVFYPVHCVDRKIRPEFWNPPY